MPCRYAPGENEAEERAYAGCYAVAVLTTSEETERHQIESQGFVSETE